MRPWRGVIDAYKKFLPVTDQTPIVTLGEGHTPLIAAKRLVRKIDRRIDLYLKFEGGNPTGSFKDRGDRKSTRLNSSHSQQSRMPSSA